MGRPWRSAAGMYSIPPGSMVVTLSPYTPSRTGTPDSIVGDATALTTLRSGPRARRSAPSMTARQARRVGRRAHHRNAGRAGRDAGCRVGGVDPADGDDGDAHRRADRRQPVDADRRPPRRAWSASPRPGPPRGKRRRAPARPPPRRCADAHAEHQPRGQGLLRAAVGVAEVDAVGGAASAASTSSLMTRMAGRWRRRRPISARATVPTSLRRTCTTVAPPETARSAVSTLSTTACSLTPR